MKQILALLFLLLTPTAASAHNLTSVKKPALALVLGLLEELTPTKPEPDQPYIVRVFASPAFVGECGGSVSSCPDVRLFITVANGDLGETPVLYQLPTAKGWDFVRWSSPITMGKTTMSSFVVRTVLPEANVDAVARKAWHSQEYHVFVSPSGGSYAFKLP